VLASQVELRAEAWVVYHALVGVPEEQTSSMRGTAEEDGGHLKVFRVDDHHVGWEGDLIICPKHALAGVSELGQIELRVSHVERRAPRNDPTSLRDEFHRNQRRLRFEGTLPRGTRGQENPDQEQEEGKGYGLA